jgi:hypothetical protein
MPLNYTLWTHLPPDRRQHPKNESKERVLIDLALQNIDRRISFDLPDDILTKLGLVSVVNEILSATKIGPFWESDLDQYLRYGLLIPRYRVKPHPSLLCSRQILMFSSEGLLQRVEIEPLPPYRREKPKVKYRHPEAVEDVPPSPGSIIENPPPLSPDVREAKRTTPLFTFSQVGAVLTVHHELQRPVDLLWLFSATPMQLIQSRKRWLGKFKERLERYSQPRFCQNPDCGALIPLSRIIYDIPDVEPVLHKTKDGHSFWTFLTADGQELNENDFASIIRRTKRSSQLHYCSPACKASALRARQPKSTERVKAWYQKNAAKTS